MFSNRAHPLAQRQQPAQALGPLPPYVDVRDIAEYEEIKKQLEKAELQARTPTLFNGYSLVLWMPMPDNWYGISEAERQNTKKGKSKQ